jgi:hypothetical protein
MTSAQWTANVASESPQLYALMARSGAQVIDGHDRDDVLATSKMYIDSLLDRPSAS